MKRLIVLLITCMALAILVGCDDTGACETNGAGGCAIQF